jgi:hypothetical protein
MGKYLERLARNLGWILLQTIIPFNPRPEEPQPLPSQTGKIDDAQIILCQAIFDQAEERRTHLEQKAQWTFAIIVFLMPLLTSLYLFMFRDTPTNPTGHTISICFIALSGVLVALGFISAVRAISVQAREALFVPALVDLKTGMFRRYSKSIHSRGLLYCAAMNTAMNDYIAQFVKGAHILVSCAVIALSLAAVPAIFEFTNHASAPTQTNIIGSVSVTSAQLDALHDKVGELKDVFVKYGEDRIDHNQLQLLQDRITKLETELAGIKVVPTGCQNRPRGHRRIRSRVQTHNQ